LAILLSRLEAFKDPKTGLEQYSTESEIAAEILWNASLGNEVKGKVVADLGCGTGILGIGALLLGAKKVYFVDSDKEAILLAQSNLKTAKNSVVKKLGEAIFVPESVELFDKSVDLVVQNPPFGTKMKHIDLLFLEKAMSLSKNIYSFHKAETVPFLREKAEKKGFKTDVLGFLFALKPTMKQHQKKALRVKVACLHLKR